MPYQLDMEQAANRHYNDGRKLFDDNRLDNAGYHFGLSAECALKHALQRVGVRGDEAPMLLHFPEFRSVALQVIGTRSAAPIRSLLLRQHFLQGWHIRMRYGENGCVARIDAERWRLDANDAIGTIT